VHVNFSGRHFSEADVLHCIRSTISRFDLPAEAIHIELTETSMLRQAGGVDDALRQLREAGHHLHLDDFGTGYASVAYLNRWRFDGIKIDRSFINQLDDGLQRNMVRGIVQMAQGLGLHVIAEGVETDAQRACLTELGCDAAQGYLFSRPVPAIEAWGLVRAQADLEPTTPRPRMRVVR
jgi:EAL domain-containing protein (putative c-di-GMP-specific phosphodiesterase class I)